MTLGYVVKRNIKRDILKENEYWDTMTNLEIELFIKYKKEYSNQDLFTLGNLLLNIGTRGDYYALIEKQLFKANWDRIMEKKAFGKKDIKDFRGPAEIYPQTIITDLEQYIDQLNAMYIKNAELMEFSEPEIVYNLLNFLYKTTPKKEVVNYILHVLYLGIQHSTHSAYFLSKFYPKTYEILFQFFVNETAEDSKNLLAKFIAEFLKSFLNIPRLRQCLQVAHIQKAKEESSKGSEKESSSKLSIIEKCYLDLYYLLQILHSMSQEIPEDKRANYLHFSGALPSIPVTSNISAKEFSILLEISFDHFLGKKKKNFHQFSFKMNSSSIYEMDSSVNLEGSKTTDSFMGASQMTTYGQLDKNISPLSASSFHFSAQNTNFIPQTFFSIMGKNHTFLDISTVTDISNPSKTHSISLRVIFLVVFLLFFPHCWLNTIYYFALFEISFNLCSYAFKKKDEPEF